MIHSVTNLKHAAFKKYPYPRSHSVGRAYMLIALYKGNMSAYTVVSRYLLTIYGFGYFKLLILKQ